MSNYKESRTKNVIGNDGVLMSSSGIEPDTASPQGSFYQELLRRLQIHLNNHGDWNWLIDCMTNETLKASEIEPTVAKYAKVFQRLGFASGDGIHLIVGNHNHSFLTVFAAWHLGGFASCGDVNLDANAIRHQLNDIKAKLVICTRETSGKVAEAINIQPSLLGKIQVLCLEPSEIFQNLMEMVMQETVDNAPAIHNTEDVKQDLLLVLWSSGTTGLPKGICHSHFTAWNMFRSVNSEIISREVCNNVSTTCFFHIGGFFLAISSLQQRQSLFHMFGADFKLEILLKAIKVAQPEALMLGAHHYVQLSECNVLDIVNADDVACVTKIFPAGSAVPAICQTNLKKSFKNLETVFNGYGQTETGIVSVGHENEHLGQIVNGVKVKIVNPDTNEICKAGEIGEICMKTPTLMLGYLNREEETRRFFDPQGYGRSGDIGYYDTDGKIYYVDRIKELIKYRNNHVSPTEIEAILQTHPQVEESLVFGKKSPMVQELISAVVVLKKGSDVTPDELREYVNSRVTIDYKQIRGDIIFKEEIPHNSVGKLLRRQMRAWAEAQEKAI